MPRIVVYGGSGFFGRLVVEELLRHTTADILVASRKAKYIEYSGQQARVKFAESDLADYGSISRTIDGASIAMLCGGPFQRMLPSLLRACIDKKVSYIDIADDRGFVEKAHMLAADAERAGVAAFIGCSVVPGLTSLLTQFSRPRVGEIEKVEIAISPGTKHPRGPASFECLLTTVGEQVGNTSTRGWSNPYAVEFPEPMGRRTVYRIVDIADYFVQPHYFGTKIIEFRIGSELWILNYMFSLLAAFRGKLRVPTEFLIGPSRFIVGLATPFGTSRGGVWIRVAGRANGEYRQVEWAVWANQRGEIIPAIPPTIAAAMLLADKIPKKGIVPPDWIGRDQLVAELSTRGVNIAARDNSSDPWRAVSAAV
jgi:saccharopine dehydrogenase-like NADP-dependent oxidoreductase